MFHSPHAPRVLLNGATCTVSISIRNLQTIRHILWFSAWSIHHEYSTRNRDWVSNFAIHLFWDRIFIAHEGQTTLLSSKNCVKALKTLKTMTPTSGLIHHHQTPSANGVVFRLALQFQYTKEKKRITTKQCQYPNKLIQYWDAMCWPQVINTEYINLPRQT